MPRISANATVRILLVEDSPDDADLMMEALKEGALDTRVTVVEDGEEALDYLRRQGAYATAPAPDLILLDLHLPRMNGFEVMTEMTRDELLRSIPVVILTLSDRATVIPEAAELHAHCYVTKPMDQEQLVLAVNKIQQFWLQR
jgi:chemotaxis family two-component system response regulator Rcp1